MIPFTIRLDNGQEQILNLDAAQRITFIPETDDQPRLADQPAPAGILAHILFSVEYSVTLRGLDADRLLAVIEAIRNRLTAEDRSFYPINPAEGGANGRT